MVQASYQFASKRRPVKTRPKFRPVPDLLEPGAHKHQIDDSVFAVNIHHDPRVARGNTFAVATSGALVMRSLKSAYGGMCIRSFRCGDFRSAVVCGYSLFCHSSESEGSTRSQQ